MSPHPVDVHVGARIRMRRSQVSMSQTTLGDAVGITFQQIQKYEKGSNRCSASKLYQFAEVLEVEPAYFFEGYGERRKPATTPDPLAERDTLELAKAYAAIQNPEQRRAVRKLASSLARAA